MAHRTGFAAPAYGARFGAATERFEVGVAPRRRKVERPGPTNPGVDSDGGANYNAAMLISNGGNTQMAKRTAVLAMLVALLPACGPQDTGEQVAGDVIALTGATLIDGNGGAPIQNAVIVIRGDRFESVGPASSVQIPQGAQVIDVSGKTIMPPIVSGHNHLAQTPASGDSVGLVNSANNFNEQNIVGKLTQFARYGILHVASRGTDKPPLVYQFRDRQRAGQYPGTARLYTAGRGFGVPGGYPPLQPDDTIDVHRLTSVDEVPAAIAELAANNVDFVKMWVDHHFNTLPRFQAEIYQAIINEAHNRGLHTVAHIHTLEDAKALVDAGVDGLIHSVRDAPVDQELIQKMLDRGLYSISTLVREESMFIYANRTPYLDDPFFTRFHPAAVVQTLESEDFQATQRANPELDLWPPALRQAQQNLKTLFDAGVKIGFGSDSGPPNRFEGYFEHREMELMAEAGLTPAQIIQIATKNTAEILGIDADYGTIEPGKKAEFLVLGANPLDNISNTKTLEQVWQDGTLIHDHR